MTGGSRTHTGDPAGPSEPLNRRDVGQDHDSAGIVANMCPEASVVDRGRRGLDQRPRPRALPIWARDSFTPLRRGVAAAQLPSNGTAGLLFSHSDFIH